MEEEFSFADGDDAGSSGTEDSDEDDDMPLAEVKTKNAQRRQKYWIENNQPMRGESADDYAKRVMEIAIRAVKVDEGRPKRRAPSDSTDKQPLDTSLGAAARKHFSEKEGVIARPPTDIVAHKECGPVQGIQYLCRWKDIGYGRPTEQWKGGDFIEQFSATLVANYIKVETHTWPC